jgi:hypothetical protein
VVVEIVQDPRNPKITGYENPFEKTVRGPAPQGQGKRLFPAR